MVLVIVDISYYPYKLGLKKKPNNRQGCSSLHGALCLDNIVADLNPFRLNDYLLDLSILLSKIILGGGILCGPIMPWGILQNVFIATMHNINIAIFADTLNN